MAEFRQVYKCEICGNIVEAIHAGAGQLVCCGQNMKHQILNTVDAAREKHVPVIEELEDGYKVTVGSVNHPMEEKHYIEWIELVTDSKTYRKFLKPGEEPSAVFKICKGCSSCVEVRAYCNLHGFWKGE